jgi:6-phosphogluconolactonase
MSDPHETHYVYRMQGRRAGWIGPNRLGRTLPHRPVLRLQREAFHQDEIRLADGIQDRNGRCLVRRNSPYSVRLFRRAADSGDPTAAGALGYAYDVGQGTPLPNSPFATGNSPQGVVAWPTGTSTAGFVYTANQGDNTISAFSYGTSQGSLQLQPATTYSTGQAPVGITIDPSGTYLYTANSGDGTVSAFSINQSTGALTALGAAVASGNLNPTLHANPGPVALAADPSGKYLYCVNGTDGSVSLFTVSAGTLTLSNTYATGAGATAIAIY